MHIKYCYRCKEAKEVILFSKSSSCKDGLNSACKPCESIRQQEYFSSGTPEEQHAKRFAKTLWKRRNRKRLRTQEKRRRRTDPVFKLVGNLRTRLNKALKRQTKSGSAVRDLGCSGQELKSYLESLWEPWMNWENYGLKPGFWSIDHIIPLSAVDLSDREQFLKVNHYTNLRPILHVKNLIKSDKVS